ncbi:MAG: hypothetical protein ACRDS1_12545 [Pseudonocardiaceae bacterium]
MVVEVCHVLGQHYLEVACGAQISDCGLDLRVSGAGWGSCCALILAGETAEDRFAADLVVSQVDHLWRSGFGLERCELPECAVWPRGVEVVQVGSEDPT